MIHVRVRARLLGRHVRRRAERDAERREPALRDAAVGGGDVHGLRHTEIRDDRHASGEDHVLRLDVAMHDAFAVGVRQCSGHVAQDVHRFVHRQLAAARETRTKRLALHEGHRIEGKPVRLARAQQWHDVRMLQSRRDLDLASEPFRAHACGQLGRQDLHDDLAPQRLLLGHEHARHPAAAELALERDVVTESRLELIAQIHSSRSEGGASESAR